MKCTLMHKRQAVADMELDEITGYILKIERVYAAEHLPVGVPFKKSVADRKALNDWWTDRSIPASRSGVREALEHLNISNTKALLVKCFGLSLSDQYWIKPKNSDITWDKINFFNNSFSEDIGDVLFGNVKKAKEFDFSSPDNTSDGCLKKRWKIFEGKRCLVKGGSSPFRQQPFNEYIASEIMKRLDISHVDYRVIWDNGLPYSVCEDFVTENTELVSAWRIMQTQKKENDVSVYRHFVNCCEGLGIENIESDLDKMITLDYIIANEDRHLNNFGLIRNAETLEWIGFAPIYDSGSSLGYGKTSAQIRNQTDIECKPFKKTHKEQIKLVTDFSWIEFEKISDISKVIERTLGANEAQEFIDESRISAIKDTVEARISSLYEMSMSQREANTMDDVEGDVERNVAENYTPKLTM